MSYTTDKSETETVECSCCGTSAAYATDVIGVYVCSVCNGVIGTATIGNVGPFIKLGEWHDGEADSEEWQYVDLTLLVGASLTEKRVHGWVHTESRKWLQIG